MQRLFITLSSAIFLTSCISTPQVNYYTLDMTRAGHSQSAYNIHVESLNTSEALSQPAIMIQLSPTQIEYYATHQWVMNLGDLIAEKLNIEFGPPSDTRDSIYLSAEVWGFEQVDLRKGAAQAHIKISISARPSDSGRLDEPVFSKTYDLTLPAASSGPDPVVQALSRGLEKLAAQIAGDLAKIDM